MKQLTMWRPVSRDNSAISINGTHQDLRRKAIAGMEVCIPLRCAGTSLSQSQSLTLTIEANSTSARQIGAELGLLGWEPCFPNTGRPGPTRMASVAAWRERVWRGTVPTF